jgi:hypothetical protein
VRGEWRSQATLFGLPVVHVKWRGTPDRVAIGIVAVGPVACGVVAIGWLGALGPIACAPFMAVGLLFGAGLLRLGWLGGSHGLAAIALWFSVGVLFLGAASDLWERLRRFFRGPIVCGRVVAKATVRELTSSTDCVQYDVSSFGHQRGCDFEVVPHDGSPPVYVPTEELQLVLRQRAGYLYVGWIAPGDTVAIIGEIETRADPTGAPHGYRQPPLRRVLVRAAVTDYDVGLTRSLLVGWFLLALAYLGGAVVATGLLLGR